MTAPARFTKADVRRAVKGVEEAGCQIGGVKIGPDGSITVLTAAGVPANDRGNPLDRLHG
jgi:hypothetical protein